MNDDAQRIAHALAGSGAAFGELVEEYQDRLYNTLLHVVGNAEDARDVAQEAFVQAFLKLPSFRGQSGFYTWLYRIAVNAAATFRRRQGVMRSAERARREDDRPPAVGDDPASRLDRDERCRQVRRAIARLGDEFRTALVLREIDGCDYETIARILDLPIGTVRSRLHRARLQLREELKEILVIEP